MFRASLDTSSARHAAVADPALSESVFQADTPARALAEVSAALGSDAEVLGIETVLRGGVGGFFAREVVQVRARPGAEVDLATAAPDARPAPDAREAGEAREAWEARGSGEPAIARVLAQLTHEVDGSERTFADALRHELAKPPAAASPAGAIVAAAPASPAAAPGPTMPTVATALTVPAAPAAGPVPGSPRWSAENLTRLGLPGAFSRAVAAQDPRDDLGWVHALGRALATLCRPLPAGDQVVVGPSAALLAGMLDVPVVTPPQRVPAVGSVIVDGEATAETRALLAAARGERWLHVIVGGPGWRELLFDEPLALSWSAPADLPVAVGLCAELGLVLGSGPGLSGQVQRANPVDLAMVLRDLLPRW